MTKDTVEREVVCEGNWCCISYAVRKDGTAAPARDVVAYLAEGAWSEGEDAEMHADEQIETYAKLMYTMQYYAEHGEGDRFESMNGLDYGIFEFKAGRARLAFYDTPGDGTYTEKMKYIDQASSPHSGSPTWCIPNLDSQIRLCHGWPKRTRLAKPSDIGFARKIRGEDISHDKR